MFFDPDTEGLSAPPSATAAWLGTISAKLRTKLAKLGLIDAEGQAPTLVEHLGRWMERKRTGLKPASLLVWRHSIRDLTALLGDKPLTELTHEDGERFRRAMLERGLRTTTVHKRLQHVRAMLEDAVRLNVLDKNPWRYVGYKSGDPSERPAYVPWDAGNRLLDVCPDGFWRLAIVLSRRIPCGPRRRATWPKPSH
ncbi:MAG: phage integrase SAM-like domain-containing protein [Gemmatales bacterium]|nr:phage integrase SAM-like domain-containing protein [Gemmatales bacterium]MDW8388300.1 phage integrase SAM-like domain-containing protein [Gemmatales bacterium]